MKKNNINEAVGSGGYSRNFVRSTFRLVFNVNQWSVRSLPVC